MSEIIRIKSLILDNWDPSSYNNNVHWNPKTRHPEASGPYPQTTYIDPEIMLPGIKFERKFKDNRR